MRLTIELDQEDDGRIIAEVPELPGCIVYGDSLEDAMRQLQSLALRVIADKIAHGELELRSGDSLVFDRAA
jgi:predicted RNase H-like HicB family nuclease